MEIIFGLIATAILIFCVYLAYWSGYKAGANRVIEEWKKTLNDMGDGENE